MALSDEDRRCLAKLEQELAAADPGLAQKLTGLTHDRAATITVVAFLSATAGFALVVAGIITKMALIGGVGFMVVAAAADWLLNSIRPHPKAPRKPA